MQKKFPFFVVVASFFLCLIAPIINSNAEEKVKEIDISTSPYKIFFDIQNGRPGDTYTKKLTVKNNGSKDFKYLFSNRFLTGSEKFYNELYFTITDNSGEIFKGKLKDFKKSNARFLNKGSHEDLMFNIYIPIELNNEFQGLSCEFQFKFYVEGTLGGTLPVDGPKLPETGTNMFNIMLAGIVLVLTGSIYQFFQIKRKRIDRKV
ncbi:LPXTG cell wall anchor domain-containing protein [Neobacillus mesonae]|uniref:Cell wall protein n=1 Tax=Neobacillus mesonae TaxID=1193713 RepID=A0A3T0I137_9BACI|nr:LPXTG cell wall anchor domain-containing protein [Neobacillus mesonae]AZU63048.1 cell wall protein [Neobacillus mesonae]